MTRDGCCCTHLQQLSGGDRLTTCTSQAGTFQDPRPSFQPSYHLAFERAGRRTKEQHSCGISTARWGDPGKVSYDSSRSPAAAPERMGTTRTVGGFATALQELVGAGRFCVDQALRPSSREIMLVSLIRRGVAGFGVAIPVIRARPCRAHRSWFTGNGNSRIHLTRSSGHSDDKYAQRSQRLTSPTT